MGRQMKESGVEWIGEIPQNWNVIKFKYVFSIIGGNGFPDILQGRTEGDYPFCKVSDINGKSVFVDRALNYITKDTVSEYNFNIIPTESILIAKIGAALQKNHRKINSVQCCIDNNTQALVRKRNDNIKYLYYLSKCIDMCWFDNNSTVPSINNSKLLDLYIPNISLNEQQIISEYLDVNCSAIDNVISKTQQSIEEYKKLKQSIITEAVTKGVRGERLMKDSGIEWIGEIPKEWKTNRLKYIASYNDDTLNENEDPNLEIEYVEIGSVTLEDGIFKSEKMLFKNAPSRARRIAKKNDVIVSTVRTYLKAIASVEKDVIVSTGFCVIRPNRNMFSKYVEFFIKSNIFSDCVSSNSVGISYPAINASVLMGFEISEPTMNEQQEIASYLNAKCQEIDILIAAKQKLINELELYKKSLIYEYVTGKKEVPSYAN